VLSFERSGVLLLFHVHWQIHWQPLALQTATGSTLRGHKPHCTLNLTAIMAAAPSTLIKRPREDPLLKQLSARLSGIESDELAVILSNALAGGATACLALLPAPRTDSSIVALKNAARDIEKKSKCRYSTNNAFALGRGRGAIAAFKKLFREQATTITATRDASAISAWASAAIEIAKGAHWFQDGLTDYHEVCSGIAGKSTPSALAPSRAIF
jgi:hypothetical protein